MWGGAEYELIAQRFSAIHDDLVGRLGARPGERWLDVATGTGEIALRAARGGAQVTAVDISENLLGQARAKADRAELPVEFELRDAQKLRFPDASFDVVSSSFGVIFAPDQQAAAGELARVTRPGGRLGLTAWRPRTEVHEIYDRFVDEPMTFDPDAWGSEDRVGELLGDAFELVFDERVWRLEEGSPEAAYDFLVRAAPPVKGLADKLEGSELEEFRRTWIDYWGKYRTDDGVSEPRAYLVVTGKRR
jgi:ubiquinone/menaquinone biosynthesis C-methylase UbiE